MAVLGTFLDSNNVSNTIETNSYLHEQSTLVATQNSYNFYNSAVYFDSYNNMWLLILQDANNQQDVNIMLNGSLRDSMTTNAYSTTGTASIRCTTGHPVINSVYMSFALTSAGISSYSGLLPAFDNWQDFLDYVTAPYVPPTQVSGGGGGLYGGYKGVVM